MSVHPDIDFSLCNPTKTTEIITPLCKIHGKFSKTVASMLYKPYQGCTQCGNAKKGRDKKLITKDLWEKGVEKYWGDQFDTSNSVIIGLGIKRTLVVCKYHGEVSVNAGDLYRGIRGCPICSKEKRVIDNSVMTKKFIEKAKLIHGDKYDYSKVKYIDRNTKIIVCCRIHGEFYITPSSLLRSKRGCRKCGAIQQRETVRKNKHSEYIQNLLIKYGDIFDFSLTKYINKRTPVVVICKQHGPFEIDAWALLKKGRGCPYCSKVYICNDEFKSRAEKIHGVGRYTYDLVQTTKHKFGVTCNICKLHWFTTPRSILSGSGCPDCSASGFKNQAPAVLYNIEFTLPTGVKLYKVGITNNTVTERLMSMKVKHDVTYKVLDEIHYAIGRDANDQEQELKKAYAEYQYTGKKFMKNGWTEIFTVNPFTYAL